MPLVRLPNLICGTLIGLAALAFAGILLSGLRDYAHEPEDVWLSAVWLVFLGPLAILCVWNASRSNEPARFSWRLFANSLAVIALAAILIIGRHDPLITLIVVICSVGPLTALFIPAGYGQF